MYGTCGYTQSTSQRLRVLLIYKEKQVSKEVAPEGEGYELPWYCSASTVSFKNLVLLELDVRHK